jgi:hypothetical protein
MGNVFWQTSQNVFPKFAGIAKQYADRNRKTIEFSRFMGDLANLPGKMTPL